MFENATGVADVRGNTDFKLLKKDLRYSNAPMLERLPFLAVSVSLASSRMYVRTGPSVVRGSRTAIDYWHKNARCLRSLN